MKKTYNLSGDLFIAAAFVLVPVGIFMKLLGIDVLFWVITPSAIIKLAGLSLLFSITLNLHDLVVFEIWSKK
ncbi:MAG: hypothetical protein ABIH27_05910 [Candidatus Omnitrophota bacterium]